MSKTNQTPATEQAAPLTLLQTFKSLGMFAPKDAQPDTIELKPGVEASFYVRALPDAEFRKLWADGDRAKLIAATICDESGRSVLTEKEAGQLTPSVAAKLQEIALKHAGFGKAAETIKEEAGND
jgi:hypothetical protein